MAHRNGAEQALTQGISERLDPVRPVTLTAFSQKMAQTSTGQMWRVRREAAAKTIQTKWRQNAAFKKVLHMTMLSDVEKLEEEEKEAAAQAAALSPSRDRLEDAGTHKVVLTAVSKLKHRVLEPEPESEPEPEPELQLEPRSPSASKRAWGKFRLATKLSLGMDARIFYETDAVTEEREETTIAHIQELYASGSVTDETLVWAEGMEDWLTYAQARSLMPERSMLDSENHGSGSPRFDLELVAATAVVASELLPPDTIIHCGDKGATVSVAELDAVFQKGEINDATGAWQYNRPFAQTYVGKFQSCMVISGRLILHAPVQRYGRRAWRIG